MCDTTVIYKKRTKLLPSIELLSAVLKMPVVSVLHGFKSSDISYQIQRHSRLACINVITYNDLMEAIKEWSSSTYSITKNPCGYGGYYIISSNGDSSWGHLEKSPWAHIQDPRTDLHMTPECFSGMTEPEAVIVAAEWLLNYLRDLRANT